MEEIIVIGAGLSGVEAANQITKLGIRVKLYEMKPLKRSKAHNSDLMAELVCSNSLKSSSKENACGLLKEEMVKLDSLMMEASEKYKLPSGQALAVDRELFSKYIDDKIKSNPLIEVIHEEVKSIPNDKIVIVATGPLTEEDLFNDLKKYVGNDDLYFYDAAAPIVSKDSINMDIAYYKSRYDKGSADYINCPFDKEQFFKFYEELVKAERVELHKFEKEIHFESCMPIEAMAQRGFKTLTFGPLKPVGLEKENERRPFAVVQLRQDDINDEMYNIVGFQTNLKFSEQKRVFSLIPGLENAKFIKYGVMHRNSFINSPKCLTKFGNLKEYPNVFIAGQLSGVEGYVESAASGIVCGINAARYLMKKELIELPSSTMLGSLMNYISSANKDNFQPMNANYGILASLTKDKIEIYNKAMQDIETWKKMNY